MRTLYAFTLGAALLGSAALSASAGAAEVCDKSCVGPACKTDCVREPNTVGRDRDVTIERRREPGVEVREHRPGVEVERTRPGVDVEVGK